MLVVLEKSYYLCTTMKILVAINGFKGCMSSHEANVACGEGLAKAFPDANVVTVDVSDGGGGFLQAMRPDRVVSCHVHDAMMRWTTASFGISQNTGVIEVAQAVGMEKIEEEVRNPLLATSYGVGELMVHAWQAGCHDFVVGLGGSATSDCGLGLLKCLRHYVQSKNHKMWYEPFDTSALQQVKVTLATDVTNPLLGENGAARVFAPQKGADARQVNLLERKAETFARMAAAHQGFDKSGYPGAGAAGGLGYAFMQFMDARVESGAELVFKACKFDRLLCDADLVVTGEGTADAQTLMGKLPAVVLEHAMKAGKPVWLVAGRIENKMDLLASGFEKVVCINDGLPMSEDVMKTSVAQVRLRHAME